MEKGWCSPLVVPAMGDPSLQLPWCFCTLFVFQRRMNDSTEPRSSGPCVHVALGAVQLAALQAPVVLPAI